MPRIVKKPHERRKELMEAALELFQIHGYHATSVEMVILKTGVAKGTFYHYFKSKDEILEAIVQDILSGFITEARNIATNSSINALKKFELILNGQSPSLKKSGEIMQSLHQSDNRELHEKINVEIVLQLSPILTEVTEQGIRENLFQIDYVLETIQFLLTGSQFLFNLKEWSVEELVTRSKAMESIVEKSLGAKKGSFKFLTDKIKMEG